MMNVATRDGHDDGDDELPAPLPPTPSTPPITTNIQQRKMIVTTVTTVTMPPSIRTAEPLPC